MGKCHCCCDDGMGALVVLMILGGLLAIGLLLAALPLVLHLFALGGVWMVGLYAIYRKTWAFSKRLLAWGAKKIWPEECAGSNECTEEYYSSEEKLDAFIVFTVVVVMTLACTCEITGPLLEKMSDGWLAFFNCSMAAIWLVGACVILVKVCKKAWAFFKSSAIGWAKQA